MTPRLPATLSWIIPSDLARVDAICQETRAWLLEHRQKTQAFAMDLLLREFLNNAIIHGNGRNPRRKVHADVRLGRQWIILRIRDEGAGFDWRSVAQRIPEESATSGRGLPIGKEYASRMRYNRAGNEITLWLPRTAASYPS